MSPPNEEIQKLTSEAMQAALRDTEAGLPEQAGALYRAVLELQPGHAGAHFGLASLERLAGRLAEALPHFASALQNAPGEEGYWLAYLDALIEARQFATAGELLALGRQHGLQGAAVDAVARELAASSAPPEHEMEAAAALYAAGRRDAAGSAARSLAERFPQHAFGWKLLGGVLFGKRAFQEALEAMRKAAVYGPDDAETLRNLGLMLRVAGLLEEAKSVLERSIVLEPDNVKAHNYLASTLQEMGRPAEAYASVTAALALDPGNVEATGSLAVILDNLGRSAEAVEAYRHVLAHEPDRTDVHSNLLFCMSHTDSFTPEELFEEHLRLGRRLEARVAPSHAWRNSPDPGRPLRIGLVSGDFRHHAVASFIEPLLKRLAGRSGLVLHAYYNHPIHDDVTVRLGTHIAQWRDVAPLDDAALEALIRADGIDILIDLSGHTAYNRLPLFARKPAPVQASWLGYPGTTGLTAIDYYLTDPKLVPPGQYDRLFTEALVYLPAVVAFEPGIEAMPVEALPALANGHLTFGSFNRLSKISRNVIALWGKLLRALPDSRLVVGGMPPEENSHARLQAWLEEEGVDPCRTRFHPRTTAQDYAAMHHQIDICLDTFPYTGGTTTVYALYMGVPTLTLASGTIAGRQTACLLAHHGLERFIAHDAEEFVSKGIAASKDLAALAHVRSSLRDNSPLWTPEGSRRVADGFEDALRRMWERWCAGLPAAPFTVPAGRR